MSAILEVVSVGSAQAVFNRQGPIVAAVRVVKGPVVRQMSVSVSGTQKVLGIITDIQKRQYQEVLEGVVGEVYSVKIVPMDGQSPSPRLNEDEQMLVCSL